MASGLARLLALFSAGLAASAESCTRGAAGACSASGDVELSPPGKTLHMQADEGDNPEANVMFLQMNLKLPIEGPMEAPVQALSGQHAPASQPSAAASASAEALHHGNASKAVAASAPTALAAASQAAPTAAVEAAAAVAALVEANASNAVARAVRSPAVAAAVLAERVASKLVAGSEPVANPAAKPAALTQRETRQAEHAHGAGPLDNILNSIGNLVSGSSGNAGSIAGQVVENIAGDAVADLFSSLVNSTLQTIDQKADALVSFVDKYKVEILSAVGQGGDKAIEAFKQTVDSHIQPVEETWTSILGAAEAAGPQLVAALSGLNLPNVTTEVKAVLKRTFSLGNKVEDALQNAGNISAALANCSEEELHHLLHEFSAVVKSGEEAVSSFADEAMQLVKTAVTGAGSKLGVSGALKASFQQLLQQVEATIGKISSGMSGYFSGTLQATKDVIQLVDFDKGAQVAQGGAVGVQALGGLVLALGATLHSA